MSAMHPTRMEVKALRQECRTCGVESGMWCLNRSTRTLAARLHENRYYVDGVAIR